METLTGRPARFEGGLREVAPGVHAWLQPNGEWGESNAVLIAGEGESLLVDTLWTPALTRAMLAAMAPHTAAAPIRRLLNTHADGDHWWGNQEVAAGGVEIIATEAAAEEMGDVTPATMAMLRRVGQAARLTARAPLLAGRTTARALGDFVDGMVGPFSFDEVSLTPATRTFSGTLTLDVGGRRVDVIEVGPAHTPGDAIVHVPDARVAIAADVLFIGVAPIMWVGPAERWTAAIDRVVELDADVIVPGHGPPTDAAGALELQRFFRMLDAHARRRFAAGDSSEAAALRLLASDEFRDGSWSRWLQPERVTICLEALRRAARGERRPPRPPERIRTFASVGRVREGIGEGA